jgi:hypothetical protein
VIRRRKIRQNKLCRMEKEYEYLITGAYMKNPLFQLTVLHRPTYLRVRVRRMDVSSSSTDARNVTTVDKCKLRDVRRRSARQQDMCSADYKRHITRQFFANLRSLDKHRDSIPKDKSKTVSPCQECIARKSQDECVICMDAKKTHIFLPCGHFAVCSTCTRKGNFQKCPICCQKLTSIAKVHTVSTS